MILALCASAQASTITLGSTLTGTFTTSNCSVACTLLNRKVGGPNPTVSPVSGVIIRWRVRGGSAVPGYTIRVLRPTGTTYTGAGSSSPQTPAGPGLEVFNSAVPIQAGDAVGLDLPSGGALSVASNPAAEYLGWEPPLKDGESLPFLGPFPGAELGYNADIQPQPSVSVPSPSSGSFKGGTGVTITGTDFASVTSVSFGSTPAQSFGVGSESQITAIAPAAAGPGPVEVSVTTIAGKSPATAGAQFTYTACIVPKLSGKKLKASKKKLRKSDCKIGKVKKLDGATAKTGEVVKQNPKPGKVLAPGSKVSIKLR